MLAKKDNLFQVFKHAKHLCSVPKVIHFLLHKMLLIPYDLQFINMLCNTVT